jgi:hypothetical protein
MPPFDRSDDGPAASGMQEGYEKNPTDPYRYESAGPEQRRGRMNEADTSAGRRGFVVVMSLHDRRL